MFNIINKFNGTDHEINVDEETIDNEIVENEVDVDGNDDEVVEEEIEDTGVSTQTEDEDEENRKYVISIDGVPFYYHTELESARKYMWSIGNNFIAPKKFFEDDENDIEPDYYITTSDLNNIKIMKTYDFFFFTYSSIVNELKIDYVIPCKI